MLNNNIKIDLHIHSQMSEYKEADGYVKDSNINNVDILLKKVQENGVNMISITDHNRFDYELYKKIKEMVNKAPYGNIKKNLPGVEFDVKLEQNQNEVCHIICIFDDNDNQKLADLQSSIEKVKKLISAEEYYTIEEFESVLYTIGLSVLLIAHQKSDFDTDEKQHHHSLSESVENPIEWIKTGYINALEYQKPRVQGMIKNCLKEQKLKFATITGSDCHVWSAYPKKDSSVKEPKAYLTTIKSLPTFKGLALSLTSPETRFERSNEGASSNYLNEIKLDNKDYKLSTGINAIIGENGSGKSYILGKLNNEEDKKYKNLDSINKINISKVGNPKITKISQGEIIDKVKAGHLLDNDPSLYDSIPSINEFKNGITNFVTNLKKYVDEQISNKESQDRINSLKIQIRELSQINNYYISLNIDVDTVNNTPQDRYNEINDIYTTLYNEYSSNSAYYKDQKEVVMNKILSSLIELRTVISKERDEINRKNKIINSVISVFNDINTKIKVDRTSQENENIELVTEIRDFAAKIKKHLIDNKNKIDFPTFPKAIEGISVKSRYGFRFIKEAKYNNVDLEKALYKELFVQNYQCKEKVMSINTKELFTSAVKGVTSYESIENGLTSNVQKFIAEYTKEETSIKDENGTDEIGTTPGEIALTFYKLQLSMENESDVILIDQPEDDISMKRIENYMIRYFNSIRDKKQIIFVTHNPLLVVNLDVDNVIEITKDKKNILSLQSGCLEDGRLLEIVSESLDGGKEAVERRLKVYGTD